jgi:hypothetical protein
MAEAENESNTSNTSPPAGKLYEQSIGIQQTQDVNLMKKWMRDIAARVMALAGRPPKYDRAKIIKVAEDLIREKGVDDYLDRLVERVRIECDRLGIETPKSHRWMRSILRSTWETARTKK